VALIVSVRVLQSGRQLKIITPLARRAVRWATPPLRELADAELDDLTQSPILWHKQLLTARLPPETSARAVLQAVDRPALVALGALALDRLKRPPGEISTALYEAIVLDTAASGDRTRAALMAVRRHPELLDDTQAASIARRMLHLAEQPVDPYEPHPVRTSAAVSAAALIAARHELDVAVANKLATTPTLRLVAAGAVQGRRDRPERLLAALLIAWNPSTSQANRFARSCDRNFSALDPVVARRRRDEWFGALRIAAQRAVASTRWVVAPIVVIVACGAAASVGLVIDTLALDLPSTLRLTGGAGLGIIAVLVAVHLVAAELSAERLAGVIARTASVPLALICCYALAGAPLILGQLSPNIVDRATSSAITYGFLAAFTVAMGAALVQLLARTDPAAAAAAFARRRRRHIARAGRDLGKLHLEALLGRRLLKTLPWLRSSFTPPLGERRVRIPARRDGYLTARRRRIRRMDETGWWRSSAGRLWLAIPLGARVGRGTEIISVVGGGDETPPSKAIRQAQRMIRISSLRAADDAAEAAGVLIDLMARLGASGNEPGGLRVAASAATLLEAHLTAIDDARGPIKYDEGSPIPMLRTAAFAIAQAVQTIDHPGTREVLLEFTERILPSVGDGDPFCAVLLGRLGPIAQHQPDAAVLLLWHVGSRIVQLDSPLLATVWAGAADDLLVIPACRERAARTAGHVVQLATYLNAPTATTLHKRLESSLDLQLSDDIRTLLRIGGSAIRSGHLSLALRVALDLRPVDLAPWKGWAADVGAMGAEELDDSLYGSLLGPDPQLVMQRYCEFAAQVHVAVLC
jgi:hypothetical protein